MFYIFTDYNAFLIFQKTTSHLTFLLLNQAVTLFEQTKNWTEPNPIFTRVSWTEMKTTELTTTDAFIKIFCFVLITTEQKDPAKMIYVWAA